MRHLLVTNDFPPKVGGIQSYLWELWRRLDPESVTVLTGAHPGADEFDAAAPFEIHRVSTPILFPGPRLVRRVDELAASVGADLVVLDPALWMGAIGRSLALPYALVLHGAEITMPGRTPGWSQAIGAALRGAEFVIAAGGYPLAEAERAARTTLPSVVVPPGVDVERFHPASADERAATRERFGLPVDAPLVTSISRLVRRKGMDVLIDAARRVEPAVPGLTVAIAGDGRDRPRLQRLAAASGAPVLFMGKLSEADLAAFHSCGDVFAMLCRDRWFGLEQEGFGIVFLEASASGVPVLAGRSGGSHEAVEHGVTGTVVDRPSDPVDVAEALVDLLTRPDSADLGSAGRRRAVDEFSYDLLALRLADALHCPVAASVTAPVAEPGLVDR